MAKKNIATVPYVGQGKTGLSSKDKKELSKAIKDRLEKERQKPKPITREDFATDEEWFAFLEFTKPIPLFRLVKVPFKTLGDYLNEYNKIMSKESNLTATQRILVKNVIHSEVRKGTIYLTKAAE